MTSPGPRPSSQCSSSSSSRSSENRSHVPKASFKHGLPQLIPQGYFTDIARRTTEFFERASRLRRENSSSGSSFNSSTRGDPPACPAPAQSGAIYAYEDSVVCQDIVTACRLMESAPHDFRAEAANATVRSAGKAGVRLGSASSSSDRPPTGRSPVGLTSPLPSARRQSSSTGAAPIFCSGSSQGRTSDGRFGLNHFPPQRDVHNGPLQAFLESSLSTISKSEAWEQWSDARSKFFTECGPLAQEVYTFACVDETIITVSPSSPTLPGSRNSPSTPFRRSPRPDYEAMLAELQSKYVKIGTSSFLNMEKAMLVHVWRMNAAANRFAQCWHRCWQVLFEHRIRGIHVPLTAMFDMQGTTISVTALPPVYVDRVPPVRNVFAALLRGEVDLHRRSAKAAAAVVGNPTVDYMLSRFFAALHLPVDDSCLEEYGDCSLYSGVDGRLYMLEIGPMLCHSTSVLRGVSQGNCSPPVRHELLRQFALDRPGEVSYCDRDLHQYICTMAIPRAIENAVSLLPQGTPESRRPEVLLRDSFLSMMCHDHGINVAYMNTVLTYCTEQLTRAVPDGLSALQLQQLEDKKQYYSLLIHTAKMEMLARTVKSLLRLDLTGGFTTTTERKTSTQVRIDMVNRIARLVASRDEEFLLSQVLPALRLKFSTPSDFAVTWDVAPVGAMLKVLSVQFGCEYGVQEGRFHAFTPFAAKVALMFYPLVAIDAMLAADEKRTSDGALQLWSDSSRCVGSTTDAANLTISDQHVFSVFHLNFLVRALAFTAVTNTHKAKLQCVADAIDGSSATSIMTRTGLSQHALADLLEAVSLHESRSDHRRVDKLNLYSQLLVDAIVASREPPITSADGTALSPQQHDRTGPVRVVPRCDVPQLSIRIIHAALQFPSAPQAGLLRHAFLEFLQLQHVDFVFSALHSQALREVETRFDVMDEQSISEFLRSVVEAVVSSLRRWNRLSNAARYLQRLTSSMTSGHRLESVGAAGRVAQLSFSVHSSLFGAHDARTLFALYVLCIFSLCSFRSKKPPVLHAVHNLHKVLDKHVSLSPALQVSFGRTAPVLALLEKVRCVLEELGDNVAVASLKTALHHAHRFTSALGLLQAAGRGLLCRKGVRRTGSHIPIAVPRTLGIVQNLGVSIDNDDDTNPSECSTLTGSFVGSPIGTPAVISRPRFTQKAERPVPLDHGIKCKPLLPDGMYSPAASQQPPAYSHAAPSHPSQATPPSYLYMPPRGLHAPPALPTAQVPANMIARTMEMQAHGAGEPSPGISSASSSTDTPNKPQSSRTRIGIMHDAWGTAPPPPPPPPETHVVHLLPSPTSSGGDPSSLARSAQEAGQISNATLALFERCDKDHDGVVSVDDCLEVLHAYRGTLARDELRELLLSCSTKAKQPGALALIFGRTRDILPIEGFHRALKRAGIVI